jgi:hypothetical protein
LAFSADGKFLATQYYIEDGFPYPDYPSDSIRVLDGRETALAAFGGDHVGAFSPV